MIYNGFNWCFGISNMFLQIFEYKKLLIIHGENYATPRIGVGLFGEFILVFFISLFFSVLTLEAF